MLKYLLPLTLLFSISTSSLAQDTFAPIGATWWYTPWCSTPNCAFYTLESVGDTLVNGQFARILEYRYNEELVPEATQIMYADEDRVYHYYDDSFEVLYDFSAKAGDTLKIRTGIFTKFFTYSEEEGYFFVIVDSTGSQQIDNTSLKVLYVSTIITDSTTADWGFGNLGVSGVIIEKIGYIEYGGMFGHNNNYVLAGIEGKLRCYKDDKITYTQSDVACDYIKTSTTKSPDEQHSFIVYPNPAFGKLYIKSKNLLPNAQIELYDLNGQLITSASSNFSEPLSISTEHIPGGVYLLKVFMYIPVNLCHGFRSKLCHGCEESIIYSQS